MNMEFNNDDKFFVGLIFLIGGIIGIIGGIKEIYDVYKTKSIRFQRVKGVIEKHAAGRGVSINVVFNYNDEEYIRSVILQGDTKKYKTGDIVTVLFDAASLNKKYNVRIEGECGYKDPICCIILSLLFIAGSLALIYLIAGGLTLFI